MTNEEKKQYMPLVSIRNRVFQTRFIWRYALLGLTVASLIVAVGVRDAREGARNVQCYGNLFHLQYVVSLYRDKFGCWPPPIISDPTGKPLYSWRVLTLDPDNDGKLYNDFDFTKPWDNPVNMDLVQVDDFRVKNRFCCHSMRHEKTNRTNFFYALSAQDRWPRDFFCDAQTPPKILFVENPTLDVYWSEPADFVYGAEAKGFLPKLRESEPPHIRWLKPASEAPRYRWFNCVTAARRTLRIPADPDEELDLQIEKLTSRVPENKADKEEEQIKALLARAEKVLTDSSMEWRLKALLLLGELGPQAKSSTTIIRESTAKADPRFSRVAAMVLAKIEK